jgi:hypothetical protein
MPKIIRRQSKNKDKKKTIKSVITTTEIDRSLITDILNLTEKIAVSLENGDS